MSGAHGRPEKSSDCGVVHVVAAVVQEEEWQRVAVPDVGGGEEVVVPAATARGTRNPERSLFPLEAR